MKFGFPVPRSEFWVEGIASRCLYIEMTGYRQPLNGEPFFTSET